MSAHLIFWLNFNYNYSFPFLFSIIMFQCPREMTMYITFFCHLLQTYKFKCIKSSKNSKRNYVDSTVAGGIFHMLGNDTASPYQRQIQGANQPHASCQIYQSSWVRKSKRKGERPILMYTRPHLHARTLKTIGCSDVSLSQSWPL